MFKPNMQRIRTQRCILQHVRKSWYYHDDDSTAWDFLIVTNNGGNVSLRINCNSGVLTVTAGGVASATSNLIANVHDIVVSASHVYVRFTIVWGTANNASWAELRTDGFAGGVNTLVLYSAAANGFITNIDGVVALDSACEMFLNLQNAAGIHNVYIEIRGWRV